MKHLDRLVLTMAVEDTDAVVAFVVDVEEVDVVIVVDADTMVEAAVFQTHGEVVEIEQMTPVVQIRLRRPQHNFSV